MTSAERTLSTEESSRPNATYLEIQKGLRRINRELSRQGAECIVEILGIAHDFRPGSALLKRIVQSDIVTLELTRRVVQTGLAGEKGTVLSNNIFWQGVIQGLQDHQEGKIIRGLEVNQTARVGWKRFSLHHGHTTLGAALFTVEVGEDAINELTLSLRPEQITELRKYSWLIVDDPSLCEVIADLGVEALERPDHSRTWPVDLGAGLSLVASRLNERRIPNYLVTLMRPPHPSLEEARRQIEGEIRSSPFGLTEREVIFFSKMAMENILLSPAELTDAREIVYTLNQFVRRGLRRPTVHSLHLGGAGHTSVITGILNECLPPNSDRIKVIASNDPRFGPYKGDIYSFFREKVPFLNMTGVVRVKGFETTVDPPAAAKEIRLAVDGNPDDFRKRVLIYRILREKYPQAGKGRKIFRQKWKDQYELYEKDIRELEEMTNIGGSDLS